jgi:predicted O-methyltransferase YrrM
MALYGCNNVVVCRGESVDVAANFNHGLIDFLFIDGSQDYESVLRDLKAWVPHLKSDGVVCGDDWNFDEAEHLQGSVRRAFLEFFNAKLPSGGIVERFWLHRPS